MKGLRVLYILWEYPQISQTYIEAELQAVREDCEVAIVSLQKPNLAYQNHTPYRHLSDPERVGDVIDEFRPHVLHSHYLTMTDFVAGLARKKNTPFTIRTHSFDALWARERPSSWKGRVRQLVRKVYAPPEIRRTVAPINDELCLGILAFPFLRPQLERAGFHAEKIHDVYPVMNYRRFYDPSPNGPDIMNVGACLPKKQMEDFLGLAQLVPSRAFHLYALGYDATNIAQLNESMGRPAKLIPPVEPENMPREYKKHTWLVYTASPQMGTVGWPVSIAEAQASGVGVCMPNLRPDLREYVGPAGFLYDSISAVAEIVSRPFPEESRQLGFQQAKKSDIFQHKQILLRLWERASQVNRPATIA